MDIQTVEIGIVTILKRELLFKKMYRLGSFKFTIVKHEKLDTYDLVDRLNTLPLLVSDPKKERIKSDNFETLLSLYQKAITEGIEKDEFLDILMKELRKINIGVANSLLYFCLFFLFRLKELHRFFSIRETDLSKWLISPYLKLEISAMILQILRYEYEFVEEKDIVMFSRIINALLPRQPPELISPSVPSVLRSILAQPSVTNRKDKPLIEMSELIDRQITELQFKNLKLKLADINPVINEDKKRSLEILDELGFDTKFHNALNAIEDYFRKGELDKQEAATCISKIGSFVQDFNLELIKRIEQIKGEKFTGKTESVASTIQYLKKNSIGFFDDKIADLYKSIYDLCSATGRHHLVSAKEDARICKNIMIELVLLALQKLQKYSSKQNEKTSK